MNIKKNNLGVTFPEVITVLVILLVLTLVFAAIVSNKGSQVSAANINEARVAIKEIVNREKMYFARSGKYELMAVQVSSNTNLDVDLRRNEHFREFKVDVKTTDGYTDLNPKITVTVIGAGMEISGIYDRDNNTEDDKIHIVL